MKKGTPIEEQNVSYYNEIANEYDRILDETDSNGLIRHDFSNKFLSLVQEGTVLDFGGGTGKDMAWLSKQKFKIYFCEPSVGMRTKAIVYNRDVLRNENVVFLNDDETNYLHWLEAFPLPVKVDAIISNFAVINCIQNIEVLFERLSFVIKPGGNLLALILKSDFKARMQSNRREAIKSIFSGKPVTVNIKFNTHRQTVSLYTIGNIKNASKNFFYFKNCELMRGNGFYLIHLIRK